MPWGYTDGHLYIYQQTSPSHRLRREVLLQSDTPQVLERMGRPGEKVNKLSLETEEFFWIEDYTGASYVVSKRLSSEYAAPGALCGQPNVFEATSTAAPLPQSLPSNFAAYQDTLALKKGSVLWLSAHDIFEVLEEPARCWDTVPPFASPPRSPLAPEGAPAAKGIDGREASLNTEELSTGVDTSHRKTAGATGDNKRGDDDVSGSNKHESVKAVKGQPRSASAHRLTNADSRSFRQVPMKDSAVQLVQAHVIANGDDLGSDALRKSQSGLSPSALLKANGSSAFDTRSPSLWDCDARQPSLIVSNASPAPLTLAAEKKTHCAIVGRKSVEGAIEKRSSEVGEGSSNISAATTS